MFVCYICFNAYSNSLLYARMKFYFKTILKLNVYYMRNRSIITKHLIKFDEESH